MGFGYPKVILVIKCSPESFSFVIKIVAFDIFTALFDFGDSVVAIF